jgi:outer membrane protein insertion porin family
MRIANRLFRPLGFCAVGLAGLILWGASSTVALAQPPADGPPALTTPPPQTNLPSLKYLQATAAIPTAHVEVADILIEGSQFLSKPEIMTFIKTRPGNEYNPDLVQEDTRNLMRTHNFADVKARADPLKDGRVNVVYMLRDHLTTIQKIVYRGAKHLKDDELNEITHLRVDTPLNPTMCKIACQEIMKKYHEQGRPFADVTLVSGDKPGDTEVVFNITEGYPVKISDIQFTGNTFVGGGVLATHINSSKKFLGLFGGDFVKEMIDDDVRKLVVYYTQFGYHDVKVAYEIQYLPDGRNAVLVYHINEGERYHLAGTPDIKGATKEMIDQLGQLEKAKAGVYDQKVIQQDVTNLQDWLGYQGIKADVQAVPVWSSDVPGIVTVHYEVKEDKPKRVGQIWIVGNDRTKMNVILRQVELYPGQIINYPAIRQAEKNLAKLGIFKSSPEGAQHPTIEVVDGPLGPDSEFKDIIIHVEEDNTGSLMFGVGVNSDAGLQGSVVINERNFDIMRPPTSWEDIWDGRAWRGAGQEFRVELVPGTEVQRYSVTWRDPYIFDTNFSLSVSGYFFERVYNEYTEERTGTRETLSHKIGNLFNWQEAQYWSANIGFRIENVNVSNIEAPPSGFGVPPVDFTSVQGNNFLVALRAGLSRDARDSFLRPTEGSLFEEVTGDHTYPLVNADFNKFWTVFERADNSGRHVLAFRSQFGWAGDNTPVYDRYYAGGFQSMRGFEFRGVGPEVDGYKIGGDFMFLNSLEYQIPIKANDSIYLVAFLDTGTVESRINQWTDYRVATGVGIRFTVPMLGPVPIALDFGIPIVRAPQDNGQVFSFWLGFYR